MIKLSAVRKVQLDDDRDIFVTDITLAAAGSVMRWEQSNNTDFEALAELIQAVVVEEDGSPLKLFKDMTAAEIASRLPADEAMKLFEAISQDVLSAKK